MDVFIGLFICTVIRLEKFKYSYGRKFNLTKLKDTKIKLPIKYMGETYRIDYDYIKCYIQSLGYSSIL